MLIFNPSYVCHDIDMDIFWPAQPASFVKFPWHYWREFSLSWKDLTKTLQSHGKLQSLTDLIHGANIDTHSNSRDWLFWMFIMSKINPLMNKSVLFWKDMQTVFSIFIKIAEMWLQSTNISLHYMYRVKVYQNCTVLCWFHQM